MSTALGLAVVVVGVLGIGIGGWSALTAQRPPWLSSRSIPLGRKRIWGLALSMLGFGASALGLFWVSDLSGGLGILGALLIFVGVGFLAVAVRPNSIRSRCLVHAAMRRGA